MPLMPGNAILVIKLGALGDFVQALGPFAAIRRHHRGAAITLLTTEPYADLGRASGAFDDVWIDRRPGAADVGGWLALRRRLRGGGFGRVYDLQTSDRSSLYFHLFRPGPRPEWSGIARGCSHPHANPGRDRMHTIERQGEQLLGAGITDVPPPDLTWATADVSHFGLGRRYVLMVPGGAAHRPAKRWPAAAFADLARRITEAGAEAVILGAPGDAALGAAIREGCPAAHDLSGRTTLPEVAALARGAALAVGNDTGPMHLIAVAGCPSVVLYSRDSDPALCAQRGPLVTILRSDDLNALAPGEVMANLDLDRSLDR